MQIRDDDVGPLRQRDRLRIALHELDAVATPVSGGHLTHHRDRVVDLATSAEPTRKYREERDRASAEVQHDRPSGHRLSQRLHIRPRPRLVGNQITIE